MTRPLDTFERWMVRSNVDRIRAEGEDAETTVSTVRANGYPRVADAIAAAMAAPEPVEACAVFLLCDRDAVTTISHPVLGHVPACQRCADKMARLEHGTRQVEP